MSLHDALEAQDYPCSYPFKLICKPDAADAVRAQILKSLGDDAKIQDAHQRASRSGKFISVTVVAVVESAAQVEQVYQDLDGLTGIVTSL